MIMNRNTALEPLEQLGQIGSGISPGSAVGKAEGRVRWAPHESAAVIMKREARMVPLKAPALLRCGATQRS
jgi:hypothetical protein